MADHYVRMEPTAWPLLTPWAEVPFGSSAIQVAFMSDSGWELVIFSPDCQAAEQITFQMFRCGQLTGHSLAFIQIVPRFRPSLTQLGPRSLCNIDYYKI